MRRASPVAVVSLSNTLRKKEPALKLLAAWGKVSTNRAGTIGALQLCSADCRQLSEKFKGLPMGAQVFAYVLGGR
jgi:hypothetical protein